ncbi:hypothetical protein GF376_03085 [Candidatus Peregrinibacteria bacterium]|nr:hypothetical protein [Candidatus Peregrinibacteria bacterium]
MEKNTIESDESLILISDKKSIETSRYRQKERRRMQLGIIKPFTRKEYDQLFKYGALDKVKVNLLRSDGRRELTVVGMIDCYDFVKVEFNDPESGELLYKKIPYDQFEEICGFVGPYLVQSWVRKALGITVNQSVIV